MVTLLPATTVLAVWIMTGMFLGLTSSLYGAMLRAYRMKYWVHVFDGIWFLLAAAMTFLVLVATNWGVLRVWTLVALLLGYGVWAISAGPLVHRFFYFLLITQARIVRIVGWSLTRAYIPWLAKTTRSHIPKRPRLPRFRRRKPPQE